MDKAILELLPASLDVWAILSLSSTGNPITVLDGKAFLLSFSTFPFSVIPSKLTYFNGLCKYIGPPPPPVIVEPFEGGK